MSITPRLIPFLSRLLLAALVLPAVLQLPLAAAQLYVSGDGSDTNDGTAPAKAFRTLKKAAMAVQPGDTVIVGNGTYKDSDTDSDSAVLTLKKSGRPDAWITFKAAPGARPEIRPAGWNGINITGSYIIVDGLIVTGDNDSLSLEAALKESKNKTPDPRYNTNGISIDGRKNSITDKPHHIIIRHCTVSKCPGGGITLLEGDYAVIEDNIVFGNCWYMRYAGSGITTNGNWAHDDAPGYHIVIQRNLVWNNKTLVPWGRTGKLSDGNGILLDVTDNDNKGATNPKGDAAVNAAGGTASSAPATPKKSLRPEWKGRALIANNVSAYNGGSGIHTFRTKHVDIINNTTYQNGQTVGYPELFANRSEDVVMLNNIIVPGAKNTVTSGNRNTNVRWDYNLYPVAQTIYKADNDIVADPLFISVNTDLRLANFHLKPGSPGRDSGTDELAQATDLTGKKRPDGKARDRGAYEQ